MFGTEKTKEDTISDLSMASIKANKQNLAKKVARNKTSEEIAEEQKGRKLGEYDPITGMYNANFASAKTATAQQGDQFDVYKMFPTSIMKTQPKNKEMADLSRFLERRMLGKIASTITENKCEWKEATRKEINSRMKKAAESSARTVNNFYENKEKIEKTRIPSEQELKTALNQREFSKRMGLKNEELKQETMKENQKRQAAISRNLKETKKEFKRATAAKPTQDIVNNTLKKMADQQLKNNGVEEI
jgi:hypothetical protein